MRLIVVSNLYPPHHRGGYELGCSEVVNRLRSLGHNVHVLTSTFGLAGSISDKDESRELEITSGGVSGYTIFRSEARNQAALRRLLAQFSPDVVFYWNLTHVSISLAALSRGLQFPACYYISDNWLATWESNAAYQKFYGADPWPHRIFSFLQTRMKLIAPPRELDLSGAMFASGYLRTVALLAGKPVDDAPIIHWGVDTELFAVHNLNRRGPLRLLYVGQIQPHKGVHTAIEALGQLRGVSDVTLTVAGDLDVLPPYSLKLREMAQKLGIGERVRFMGKIVHSALPEVYREHDVLVFPSAWDEPFAITPLEAMSCGLAVVGTTTGGSAEIFNHDINALTFPKEDSTACAYQIRRLIDSPDLLTRLKASGRQTVRQHFRIEQMVASIEATLIRNAKTGPGSPRCSANGETVPLAVKPQPRHSLWLAIAALALLPRHLLVKTRTYEHRLKVAVVGITSKIIADIYLAIIRHRPSIQTPVVRGIRNIVVFQLADIGDVVLTGPFLRGLRALHPDAWLGVVTQPSTASLLKECPYVDQVISLDYRSASDWKRGSRGSVRWWLKAASLSWKYFRRRPIDLAINTRWNGDAEHSLGILCAFLTGAPRRVGYLAPVSEPKKRRKEMMLGGLTDGPERGLRKHEVERQLDLLRYLGGDVDDTRLQLWTTPEDELYAEGLLAERGLAAPGMLVALSPGAGWVWRRWPVERFIELSQLLRQTHDAYFLVLGSKADKELGSQIQTALGSNRVVNLAGESSLRQTAAFLRRCKLFIGNDSGPMHMAAAAGVATVGIFGSGEYQRFRPWGVPHEVVRLDLLCSPCGERCLFEGPRCINGLTVAQVVEAAQRLLYAIERARLKPSAINRE